MTTTTALSNPRIHWFQQVAAVLAGGFVASAGLLVAFIGMMLSPPATLFYLGFSIMATAPFVMARVAASERWALRGALGLAVGAAAFFLAGDVIHVYWYEFGIGSMVGAFGIAAAVALPAHDRWVKLARTVGICASRWFPG